MKIKQRLKSLENNGKRLINSNSCIKATGRNEKIQMMIDVISQSSFVKSYTVINTEQYAFNNIFSKVYYTLENGQRGYFVIKRVNKGIYHVIN